MSGASIDLGTNADALGTAIDDIAARLDDVRPMLHDMGAYGILSTQRRFETRRGPDGQPWAPLARRTARERIKRGRDPANILRLTARLYQSFAVEVTGTASAAELAWGTNVAYAAIHQFGGTIAMPARESTIYRFYDERRDEVDWRFRSRARSNFASTVSIGAYTITIPARPYLGIDDADLVELTAIGEQHLAMAIGGAA